ncbi:MAG: hypothetical protein GQ565_11750 [Candidatus Aegiribacteria sp.]|nr:hypothetical protein [Candidatus Aegiribacteria sp.]
MSKTAKQSESIPELRISALALMAILGENSMTGYEIKKTIDSSEMNFWKDSFGSIYPNLQLLTKLGYAKKTLCETTGRKRTAYALTELGKGVVNSWLELPERQKPVKIELLLKLRFGYRLGENSVEKLLKSHIEHQKELLPDLYETIQHIDGLPISLELETKRMTTDFLYRYTRMMIEWSEFSLTRLDKLKK